MEKPGSDRQKNISEGTIMQFVSRCDGARQSAAATTPGGGLVLIGNVAIEVTAPSTPPRNRGGTAGPRLDPGFPIFS